MRKRTRPTTRVRTSKATRAKPDNGSMAEATAEYQEYLQRYALYGEGRPRLSPTEFDSLDDELLELLAIEPAQLDDERIVRLEELEYLLIESQ